MSRSLNELLNVLHRSDEEIEIFSQSELRETVGDIKDKVDNLKAVLLCMEADAERFRSQEVLFAAKKKAAQNGIRRLKEYVAFCMKENDTPKLYGEQYSVSLQKRTSLKYNNTPVGADTALDLAKAYGPETVSIKLNATYAKDRMVPSDLDLYFDSNESSSAIFRVKKS